jgi:hypothetical protein
MIVAKSNNGMSPVESRPTRKFEELSDFGLQTGLVAYVTDIETFGAGRSMSHWREVDFDIEKELLAAVRFDLVIATAQANGFALVTQ